MPLKKGQSCVRFILVILGVLLEVYVQIISLIYKKEFYCGTSDYFVISPLLCIFISLFLFFFDYSVGLASPVCALKIYLKKSCYVNLKGRSKPDYPSGGRGQSFGLGFFYKLNIVRTYSTLRKKIDDTSASADCSSLVVFSDADKYKLDIINYVKGESGIYMWTNKLNGKKYVGSSVDLKRRLLEYYNMKRLITEKSMPINIALLKYGYSKFSLTILEFCDIDSLMSREKHYFEVYSPEYNILKTPGSPSLGSGWKHSEATLENMRIAAILVNQSPETLAKKSAAIPESIGVEVTDLETNTSTSYHAIKAAARALGIDRRYIENYLYLKQENPVLGRYTFKLLKPEKRCTSLDRLGNSIQKTSLKVEATNVVTQEVTLYPSIGSAARALGYRQASISLYLKENRAKPFKGLYLFKLVD